MPANPSDESDSNRAGIPEDAAHRLLARAAELDAQRGGELSVAQLREIAAEAGIGREAFETALREYDAHTLDASSRDRSADTVRRTTRRGWAELLARHRALAAVVTLFGVACATPGDLVITMLVVSAPAYALYELGIALARRRLRKSGTPPASPTDTGSSRAQSKPAPHDNTTRRLLLRTA